MRRSKGLYSLVLFKNNIFILRKLFHYPTDYILFLTLIFVCGFLVHYIQLR